MLLSNSTLRLVAVLAAAGLFIPAWAVGATLLWVVPMAVIVASHCRGSVHEILQQLAREPLPIDAGRQIICRLGRIVLECILITLPPQLIAILLKPQHGDGLDRVFYYHAAEYVAAFEAQQFTPQVHLAQAIAAATATTLVALVLVAGRSIKQAFQIVFRRSSRINGTATEVGNWINTDAVSQMCGLAAMCVPLFFGAAVVEVAKGGFSTTAIAIIAGVGAALPMLELICVIGCVVASSRCGRPEIMSNKQQ